VKQINEFRAILSSLLDWNKCRIECLAQIIQALFVVGTINLSKIATAFQTDVKIESSYRRVCRFFTNFNIDMSTIILFIFQLFTFGEKYILIMDRTNWKWGNTPINILMISIAYRGISIPFFWAVLNLEGNSCSNDRISLLQRVLDRISSSKIETILADREFIGTEWFNFLIKNRIPFIIRGKDNFVIEIEGNRKLYAKHLRKTFKKKKIINHLATLWSMQIYISIERRRGSKEAMILISNHQFDNPFSLYRRRWEIETMFGCLKTRGFRMEDTHVTDPDKIEKVLFVLAIAFCWAYKIGDVADKNEPLKTKKHGRKIRSLFREGLNQIQRAILRSLDGQFSKLLRYFKSLKSVGYAT
jgi:hypothetical protein